MTILTILNIYSSNIGKFTGAVLTSSARQQQRADRKIRRVLFMAAVKEEKKLWVKLQIESGDIYVPLAQHNQILTTVIFECDHTISAGHLFPVVAFIFSASFLYAIAESHMLDKVRCLQEILVVSWHQDFWHRPEVLADGKTRF